MPEQAFRGPANRERSRPRRNNICVANCSGSVRLGFAEFEERPAARGMAGTRVPSSSLAPPALGVNQRAQVLEAVRRNQARRHKFP